MKQFILGQTVYVATYRNKAGLACKISEAKVTGIIPNYLGKYGLRYGIAIGSRVPRAYRPEDIHATREAAAAALRKAAQADISSIQAALALLDNPPA